MKTGREDTQVFSAKRLIHLRGVFGTNLLISNDVILLATPF